MQQQEQYQPVHADRHGSSFNLTLVIALVVLAMGIVIAQDPLMVAVGLAVAAFSWLTTPGQYMLYPDRLIIAYGKPRIRHVLFRDIAEVQMLKFAFGSRLLVRLHKGSRILIQPRDAEEFESRFQGALESYMQQYGGQEQQEQQQQQQQPPQGEAPYQQPDDQDNWPSRE